MIITKTRTYNDINITINGYQVPSTKCIKYLGLHIDQKWNFTEHARIVAAKAGKVVRRLSRIMPNISAAKPTKRKLLSNVAHSVLLYGAPVWAGEMSAAGWKELLKVQRRICLRVASAYCTTSREAACVIVGIAPLNLLAKERKQIHDRKRNREQPAQSENILDAWQTEWDSSTKGRWTQVLIPNIGPWIDRRHGEVNYDLTQALSLVTVVLPRTSKDSANWIPRSAGSAATRWTTLNTRYSFATPGTPEGGRQKWRWKRS
uniref:Retrovirus-related Pol polyprotein from type-1 retrotransposable element R1 n=1 Tax=Schizaphis graminum TaxID=13262 RepID=A0A2S2NL09_SCHGA